MKQTKVDSKFLKEYNFPVTDLLYSKYKVTKVSVFKSDYFLFYFSPVWYAYTVYNINPFYFYHLYLA